MGGDLGGVDSGRGDDHMKVGATGEKAVEIAEEEVDVQTALVGLVDDDHVVGKQVRVVREFGEQDAIGHYLDRCLVVGLVVEPHRVTDCTAYLLVQLFGDSCSNRASSYAARLGVANHSLAAEASV